LAAFRLMDHAGNGFIVRPQAAQRISILPLLLLSAPHCRKSNPAQAIISRSKLRSAP
jgi:hypothetical protein